MKLIDLGGGASRSLDLKCRDYELRVKKGKDFLSIEFYYCGDPDGEIVFDENEVKHLIEIIKSFFVEDERKRTKFNYDSEAIHSEKIPQMRVSTTNWGFPYDQGLRFEFSDNFKDYTQKDLSFAIVDDKVKELLDFLV